LTSVRCDADRFEFEKATLALTKIVRQPKLPQQTIFESVGACQRLARAAVAKVITLAPESTWAGLLRAQAAEKSGDIETVEKEYERAIAASNAGLESYVQYGQFESKHSRYERALALYEQALTIEPNNPRVLGLIGEAHTLQDKSEKAIPYLEKALLANPHETQTRLYLAQSLVRLKRQAEAVRILEVAPEDPDGRIHYLLGRTYQQMGANEKARKAMDEFRRLRKEPEP
jgi:tetratricopeptide (TPR) repeat protein